jgi:hypothetical protein
MTLHTWVYLHQTSETFQSRGTKTQYYRHNKKILKWAPNSEVNPKGWPTLGPLAASHHSLFHFYRLYQSIYRTRRCPQWAKTPREKNSKINSMVKTLLKIFLTVLFSRNEWIHMPIYMEVADSPFFLPGLVSAHWYWPRGTRTHPRVLRLSCICVTSQEAQ